MAQYQYTSEDLARMNPIIGQVLKVIEVKQYPDIPSIELTFGNGAILIVMDGQPGLKYLLSAVVTP